MIDEEKLNQIAYSEDASQIKGEVSRVFFPETVEQIKNEILFGNNFVIRGGGSNLMGSCFSNNSIIIDMSKMNKILALNKEKKEVIVEPGVVLSELNEFLAEHDLEFPIIPLSEKVCTIGGMIAMDASGFREIKHGKTSNWVLELEIINSRGELVKIRKTDLSDVVGMEGITGIITKAKLKLIKKTRKTASFFEIDNIEKVLDLAKKLRLMENVSMIFFIDKFISSLLDLNDKYHILVEFEGDEGKLKEKDYEKIIKIRKRVYPNLADLGYILLEDPKIFLDKLIQLAELLERLKIPFFADLGSGVVHPVFLNNQKDLIDKILNYTKKLHGKVNGKFGVGVKKKKYMDNVEKGLVKRVKIRYDSDFKFNPGIMIDKEVKMKKVKIEEDEEVVQRRKRNIEETKEELDKDLKHEEEIDESETADDLDKAVEEE